MIRSSRAVVIFASPNTTSHQRTRDWWSRSGSPSRRVSRAGGTTGAQPDIATLTLFGALSLVGTLRALSVTQMTVGRRDVPTKRREWKLLKGKRRKQPCGAGAIHHWYWSSIIGRNGARLKPSPSSSIAKRPLASRTERCQRLEGCGQEMDGWSNAEMVWRYAHLAPTTWCSAGGDRDAQKVACSILIAVPYHQFVPPICSD